MKTGQKKISPKMLFQASVVGIPAWIPTKHIKVELQRQRLSWKKFSLEGRCSQGQNVKGIQIPRDPNTSPKLRMVSWNLNTWRFGGDCTPQSSSDKVIGSLGNWV